MSLIAGNLGVVQRLLDQHNLLWGVCAGAAAHVYGNRRPIQDIDILVMPGGLAVVVQLLQRERKAVQCDGKRALWRGIKLFDDLSIWRVGSRHAFVLDSLMSAHMRRLPLLGSPVAVLAPEDVIVHKLLLNRGPAQGKHDYADAAAIVRRQELDRAYLEKRLCLANAREVIGRMLEALDVTLDRVTAL